MKGACPCRNIELHWQLVDLSLVPRKCDCAYCSAHGVSWVSKSGTRLRATVHNPGYYSVTRQGMGMASFHECTHCRMPVFASASIAGEDYAVVNAACLSNPGALRIRCRFLVATSQRSSARCAGSVTGAHWLK